jgi:hypothetical protein
MLNQVERRIMNLLFERCMGKSTVLFSPAEIQEYLAPTHELTFKQIEISIKNLMVDGFIDVYHSDNKGKLNYVISLKTRGEGYKRELQNARSRRIRSIGWKVFLAAVGVLVTLILTNMIGG